MWLDRIVEAKERKGLTINDMVKMSKIELTDRAISHILTGKSKRPSMEAILDICGMLDLSPIDIFADTSAYVADKTSSELQAKIEVLVAEKEILLAENVVLAQKVKELTEKVDKQKDEIIETHHYYIKKLNEKN